MTHSVNDIRDVEASFSFSVRQIFMYGLFQSTFCLTIVIIMYITSHDIKNK